MLKVIQQQQELLFAQIGDELLERGELRVLGQAEGVQDGGHDQVRVAESS